jgi:methionine-rich copper-binding protein CopC
MTAVRVMCALAMAAMVAQAHAHAFLDRSEPRVGAAVSAAPAEVKLWFTEPVEPAFSTVSVVDADGKRVDKADARVDATDRQLLRISLRKLPPGRYRVVWRAVSLDTHVTQGDFAFRVGE